METKPKSCYKCGQEGHIVRGNYLRIPCLLKANKLSPVIVPTIQEEAAAEESENGAALSVTNVVRRAT
jgi:hypothetical protein